MSHITAGLGWEVRKESCRWEDCFPNRSAWLVGLIGEDSAWGMFLVPQFPSSPGTSLGVAPPLQKQLFQQKPA